MNNITEDVVYYTIDEIHKKFSREERIEIAKLIWKDKPGDNEL